MSEPRLLRSAPILRATVAGLLALFATAVGARDCVPVGTWVVPSAQGPLRTSAREVLMSASRRSVVLLGELHDRVEHHRWQLQTMVALHALRENLVLGFEMFPRRVQPVLDRWVAGALGEVEFLKQSDWARIWGFESAFYLPLFHFARLNRIPMLALNVERNLIREIGRKGVDAVPESMREGVGRPAAPPQAYVAELHAVYLEHPGAKPTGMDDPEFTRFVDGQLTWDRAMAEAIRGALDRHPGRQVIAVMGRGHTAPGAVPHQLRDLGVTDVAVLLPWENDMPCEGLVVQRVSAVFGVEAQLSAAQPDTRPRLGVMLAAQDGSAVRVDRVMAGSIAESAGLRAGDIVLVLAGTTVTSIGDVQRVVSRQAPGTWLPVRVRRDGAEIELIAKFPPE